MTNSERVLLEQKIDEYREQARRVWPLESAPITAEKRKRAQEWIWWTNVANDLAALLRALPQTPEPETVSCNISELRGGKENNGPLESTDLYVCGRGVSLLVNADEDGDVSFSLSVDKQPVKHGYVKRYQIPQTPEPTEEPRK